MVVVFAAAAGSIPDDEDAFVLKKSSSLTFLNARDDSVVGAVASAGRRFDLVDIGLLSRSLYQG